MIRETLTHLVSKGYAMRFNPDIARVTCCGLKDFCSNFAFHFGFQCLVTLTRSIYGLPKIAGNFGKEVVKGRKIRIRDPLLYKFVAFLCGLHVLKARSRALHTRNDLNDKDSLDPWNHWHGICNLHAGKRIRSPAHRERWKSRPEAENMKKAFKTRSSVTREGIGSGKEKGMRNRRIGRVGLAAMILVVSAPALGWAFIAKDAKPTASGDVGIYSQYIWRGFALSDDSVVIQPSATVEYAGFRLNLWGNLDTDYPPSLTTPGNEYQWNETDFTLAYDRGFGPVAVGVGYIYYALDAVPDSQEIYLSLGADVPLSPTFTVYREMAYDPGWYMNLGISYSHELTESGISLDLAGSVGYLDPDGGAGGYFNEALISLGFTIPFCEYFSVSPMVAYTVYLSGKAYDTLKANPFDNKAEHIYGGVSLSVAF